MTRRTTLTMPFDEKELRGAAPGGPRQSTIINPLASSRNIRDHMKIRSPPYCRALQPQPAMHLLAADESVAFDAEFQKYKAEGSKWGHRLGSVSVVGESGQVVVHTYVHYEDEPGVQKGVDPPRFGVLYEDLKLVNGARPAAIVEAELKQIFSGRKVIMHDTRGDTAAFYIIKDAFVHSEIVDTQVLWSKLQDDGRPGLRTATSRVLHREIQGGGIHDPNEDSRATMDLFLAKEKEDHEKQAAWAAEEAYWEKIAMEDEAAFQEKAALEEEAAYQAVLEEQAAALQKKAVAEKQECESGTLRVMAPTSVVHNMPAQSTKIDSADAKVDSKDLLQVDTNGDTMSGARNIAQPPPHLRMRITLTSDTAPATASLHEPQRRYRFVNGKPTVCVR